MHRQLVAATLLVFAASLSLRAADDSTPFNGTDLKGWKLKGDEKKSKWVVGKAEYDETSGKYTVTSGNSGILINSASGVDISTEQKFGDCRIEIEFAVPKNSNSGIYVMGEYEIQIYDSYGKEKVGPGDLGGLYGAAAPSKNASKKPGEWQKFVIEFQAPQFKDEKKISNAKFVKIELNGTVIHENIEMKGPTPGGLTGKEAAEGPLMFQGDHGVVVFKSIKITPLK